MSAPRRYRVALRAYPAAYRRGRGSELMATLADGDDDRGKPSTREAGALVLRGLTLRGRAAIAPEGLLTAAAVLVLVSLIGGFSWADRVLFVHNERGDSAPVTITWDGPGIWWQIALAVAALVVLAAGPLRALDDPRRRGACLALVVPLSLAVYTTPGRILHAGLPDVGALVEFLRWLPATVFHSWELTVPTTLAAVLGTALALPGLRRLSPLARQRLLAGALSALAGVAIAQTWQRPGLVADYGQSAFADLGPGTFIAVLGLVLALLSLVPRPLHPLAPSPAGGAQR